MENFYIYPSLPSTNAYALTLPNPPHGTAILALEQTKGHGQHGRTWESPLGGMYLSIVLKDVPLENLTLKIGEIIKNFLENFTNAPFTIKPPNDILYNNKKICGILVESKTCGTSTYAVCGIGLDVNNKWQNSHNLAEIMGKEQNVIEIAKKIRECILNEI